MIVFLLHLFLDHLGVVPETFIMFISPLFSMLAVASSVKCFGSAMVGPPSAHGRANFTSSHYCLTHS